MRAKKSFESPKVRIEKERTEMSQEPIDIKDFVRTPNWWRTKILTELVPSENGVAALLKTLEERDRHPFFILDDFILVMDFCIAILARSI